MFSCFKTWGIGSVPGWESNPRLFSRQLGCCPSSPFYLNLRHIRTHTPFFRRELKTKKVYTCFYSERSAFADRFPSLTSSHGTLRPLWGTSHVADHTPPSCSCCRTSVELARSQSARGIADCRGLLTARSLGWKSGGGGMGPCSQPASWDRHLAVKRERERTMVLSIVVLSMCLWGGGGGGGGGDARSQTKERRDKKVGIKSESSLIKCAIREIRTADL